MAFINPDDLWTPFKHFQGVLETYLLPNSTESNITNLEQILRKHKQNFSTLLKNPPKNVKSREEIRRGITDGVSLPGLGHTILSKDLVDEAVIISDMFDLNEFIALELLCSAQQQMPYYPGLPRGLVAILLYYDGRKALTTSLKTLMQARYGISWCISEASHEIIQLITNYTDDLVEDGVLDRVIDLVEQLDITKELDVLTSNRALGPPKHHRQVLDLYEEIRQNLATSLFNYSVQSGLPKCTTIKLIKFLSKCKSGTEARGCIDSVTTTMLLALLYALDLSVIQKHEDGEEIVKKLPIIRDESFIEDVIDELLSGTSNQEWDCTGLYSMTLFSLGLAIGTLRLAPQNLYTNASRIIDQDENLVDTAIQLKVFDFIHYTFLENDIVFKTEFFYRRIHQLFTDFIEIMHSKVTELRARADETARTVQAYQQQGVEPPSNLCHNFETLLLAVGKFYGNDPLDLNLSLEYWGPMETAGNYQRSSSRSVCLFKFIRLAGELLPPILFIPYLKMLSGLSGNPASARNAFNLLKQGSGVSGSATVSWDHFFSSLARYYSNLRQEQQPSVETIYRNRAISRNISPQEISGLQAVLELIKTIANHDEVARVALCEQPSWAPLHVILGLVSCSIMIPLKSNLVLTLNALGKSTETAVQLWNLLEASQVIVTIPSTSSFGNRGIASELEEIESRNESYPLTKSVLDLLYTLSSIIVPKNLGAGTRKPGLDPYLTFIIDTVFLKFYNRNYKDIAEKWEIAEKCLKILNMFVESYEVSPGDFPVSGSVKDECPDPGFHIALQMHTKSQFLCLILHLIDEACTLLDSYTLFPGKKHLETSILYCLNIIESCLTKQEAFFNAHFASNSSILLSGLNKLLLGVNSRSGKADHMLNITKFVMYNNFLPKHSLQAIKILTLVIRQPNVNSQLLGIFTHDEKIKQEIRQGFVECLENEFSLDDSETVELEIKEAVINLLQECLPQSAPNIAHYLLGFDINKDIRLTRLQQPGVMGFPCTCSKSLITVLDNALENSKQARTISVAYDQLIEKTYSLLYSLCFNTKTSEVFLRFLRSCNDFLCRHVAGLPFHNSSSSNVLNQMTGLLKSVAIELKLTADNNQISQFSNLCKILLGTSQNIVQENVQLELGHYHSMINASTIGDQTAAKKSGEDKLLICELLDTLNFGFEVVDRPKWDYFDNSQMQNLFKSCEVVDQTGSGLKLIDLKKLHDILKDELNSVQTTIVAGQRQFIMQEIEGIMVYALQTNKQKNICSAKVKYLKAWSQVTEIIFSVQPRFFFKMEVKQNLILEILQSLLKHVVPAQIMQELANLASSTVLLLLMNLRTCYIQKIQETDDDESRLQTLGNITFSPPNQAMHSPISNTLNLKYILKNIVEWIITSGVGSQKLRMNLYASLLNFIYIVKYYSKGSHIQQELEVHDEHYVSRLDRTVIRKTNQVELMDESNEVEMSVEILQSFGDKLIDILCHDCTGGHDVCKMLALSCIDMLLDIDTMSNFIQFISKRGYLAHLIDSLLKTDAKLCRILDNQPENLKALYVYESKMAMLSRFGSSYVGAELLLEQKALGVLSQMKVYDLHPDFQVSNYHSNNSFVPPIDIRYQQILFPALNLCDVILSTLGPENHSVITQITHFLLSHGDMIEIVMRAGTPNLNVGLLQELSAITGLVARASNQEITNMIDPNANHDIGAHLYRLQKLMLTLFPRFVLSEQIFKQINQPENLNVTQLMSNNEKEKATRVKLFLQIAVNLSLYARNCISNHSIDHRTTKVLFSVNINEGIHRNDARGGGTIETSPNLGIVVSQLKNCVEYYNQEKMTYDALLRQRNSLPNINLNPNFQLEHNILTDRLMSKQQELKLCVFVTEHCLYLLWAHLDFYMLRALNMNTITFNGNLSTFGNDSLSTSSEARNRITSEEIGILKKTLVSVFNETFSKQLLATTQDQTAADKGFVDSLLRRIKRLIQFVPVN